MQEYLLFIDTETSGLPKKWQLPYSNNNNWPYAVQVSWIIYKGDGTKLKSEDHYINNDDFVISDEAFKVHGITREYLNNNGISRNEVLELLTADLNLYKPLVVGHFMELDYHVTGADFYRSGMSQPIDTLGLQMFCTMLGTRNFSRNPQVKHLKLGELYSLLFDKQLPHQHNAMVDASATADCFFELVRMGSIDDERIAKQQVERQKAKEQLLKGGCAIPFSFILILTILIIHWL